MLNNVNKLYAGIDLHKTYMFVTVMNKDGYIQRQGRFENRDHTLIPALLQYNIPVEATVESSYGWYWLADDLDNARIPFLLAHPKKVNAIVGKKKTDKEDSKALADLLRTNLLPQAYIPTKMERNLKELLRFRLHLVENRSTIKRRIHDILAKQNIICEYSDVLGKKAHEWLSLLNCPSPYQEEIDSCLLLADNLTVQIDEFTNRVKDQTQQDANAQLLLTIPGIGDILALTLSVEIGDVFRFANDRALASYAGVVPSVHSSGDKTHYGPVSKHGNKYIRWALAEALVHITGEGKPLHDLYERLKEKKGSPTARVAVMNKMMRIIYAMLTKKRPYSIETLPLKEEEKKTN